MTSTRPVPCSMSPYRARVPAYAPALGQLAGVDAALGASDAAINRLRPLAASATTQYAASLASVLSDAGQPVEAEQWRMSAAARYDELVVAIQRPSSIAPPNWLTMGGDSAKGAPLAGIA